jgi:stage III sporulation protein AE
VVRVKHLSADESAYTKATEAEDGTDAELSRLWERFLQILPSEISDLALHLGEYDGKKLWEQISEVMAPARDEIIRTAALLLAMIVLYTACELIPTHSTVITNAASSALSAFLAVPILTTVISLVGNSVSALRSSSEFFGELIPIMTSVAAVGVGGGTAALTASLASVALGICDGVVIGSVYPLFALSFTLAALDSIDTGRTVASFSKGIKKLVALLSGAAPIVIGGILSLGTLISASRDTLALRGAKYALSGMVPVVGNVISGSIGALISGCKLLSGVLGPLAVCAVLYYLASPLLSLLTMRFLISTAAGAAEMLGAGRGAEMLGRMRGALDAIIAPIGASALIYVFEIVIFIGTVSGVNI